MVDIENIWIKLIKLWNGYNNVRCRGVLKYKNNRYILF